MSEFYTITNHSIFFVIALIAFSLVLFFAFYKLFKKSLDVKLDERPAKILAGISVLVLGVATFVVLEVPIKFIGTPVTSVHKSIEKDLNVSFSSEQKKEIENNLIESLETGSRQAFVIPTKTGSVGFSVSGEHNFMEVELIQ